MIKLVIFILVEKSLFDEGHGVMGEGVCLEARGWGDQMLTDRMKHVKQNERCWPH